MAYVEESFTLDGEVYKFVGMNDGVKIYRFDTTGKNRDENDKLVVTDKENKVLFRVESSSQQNTGIIEVYKEDNG